MVVTEENIVRKNIQNLRLINEAVGGSSIVDAINDRKVIYIYYAGDETILKGYRTIKPFVLGKHKKSGNDVVRAWQDAGSSDSFVGLNRTPRMNHEKHPNHKGTIKPGWRLFRLDGISSLLPTGQKFDPDKIINNPKSSVKYNPNDKDMSSITAAINDKDLKKIDVKGLDSIQKDDVVSTKIDKKDFDKKTATNKRFFKAAKKSRNARKNEIETLWDVAKKYKKKSPRTLWVVQNEKGDMVLKSEVGKNKSPEDAVVGNLKDLYNKLVLPTKKTPDDFFKKEKNRSIKK